MTASARSAARRLLWAIAALPGLAQLYLLGRAMIARVTYPYDLEWMEGGLLAHAYRIEHGLGGYVEPSVHFIPYLYTPLYPGLLAALSPIFGLSYELGRAISILSAIGIAAVMAVAIAREAAPEHRAPALCGGAMAAGFFAATYPWVEGWYDLVRADTLFMLMALGGLLGVRAWARAGAGAAGQLRIAAAGALLALSFFCKQTGVLFVAAGGALLFALRAGDLAAAAFGSEGAGRRVRALAAAAIATRVPTYVAVTGTIGLGGVWLFNQATGDWFWIYAYEVHQTHDFSWDRFRQSFGHIFFHFPAMTAVVGAALALVIAAGVTRRALPAGAGGLFVWTFLFACGAVMGAVGWGTQWAHFNAYIPAMIMGAIAAGAALPALAGAAEAFWPRSASPKGRSALGHVTAGIAAVALGVQLILAWWNPEAFIPTDDDRRAGDALIERVERFEGDVFIPYHPWYAYRADKPLYVHRMGLLDIGYSGRWEIRGVGDALRDAEFDAVILDNRPVGGEFPGLRGAYERALEIPESERPSVYSGAPVVPESLWIPRGEALPDPEPPAESER